MVQCHEKWDWFNINNQVWDLIELPKEEKTIGCKWVFKAKRDSSSNISRYKVKLVAKWFTQQEGIDYYDTFSSISKNYSFQIIMALVAHFNMELHQMDVKTIFLNRDLKEEIYMKQLKGLSQIQMITWFASLRNLYIW